MKSLAIIDDHFIVREGIKSIFKAYPEYYITHEAPNGRLFLEMLEAGEQPEIAIIDINMPFINGFELLQELKTHHSRIKAVVYSMIEGNHAIRHLTDHGAAAFVSKRSEPALLINTIRKISEDAVNAADTVETMKEPIPSTPKNSRGFHGNVYLTNRELQFLKLFSSTLSYIEIGQIMGIELKTTENYRDRIYQKLAIHTRIELSLFAITNGLFDPISIYAPPTV